MCSSQMCRPCVDRRVFLDAELAAKPKTITKLPAYVGVHPGNFIGMDGLPRYATSDQRRTVYDRDNGLCAYCHRRVTFQSCNIDHLIPWPKGKTIFSNLVVACRGCNKLKGRYDGSKE